MKNKTVITPAILYLLVSLIGIGLFFPIAFIIGPEILEWVAMENNSNYVMTDYFRHVQYAQNLEETYYLGTDTVFPALAYLIYHFIAKCTATRNLMELSYFEVAQEPYQMMLFLMYTVVGVALLIYSISELKIKEQTKYLLAISILFSTPVFTGAIERGNMALYVCAILLIVYSWRESENAVKREFALILIAVAAGLKVYPAVYGIIYLKEKRYKEALRLVLYGVIFFFVPFYFMGGYDGFVQYLNILIDMMGRSYEGRIQFFKGAFWFIGVSDSVAGILNWILMIVLLWGMFFTKSKMREMGFLATFMALIPTNAFRYTLIYFLLCVFVLFNEERKRCIIEYFNAIMLGFVFSIPTLFGIITGFEKNFGIHTYTYVERWMYTLIYIWLGVQLMLEIKTELSDCILKMKSKIRI